MSEKPQPITLEPWKGRGPGLGLLVLALYASIAAFKVPAFLHISNVNAILYSAAVVLPATLGMQALLILGQFDLSVGAAASLAGMVAGLAAAYSGSVWIAVVSGGAVAAAIGLSNGLLVTRLRINPLITTLATMGIMRSASLVSSDSRVVTGFPQSAVISTDYFGPISVLVLLASGLLVIAEALFRYSAPFRRFYAVGDNPSAADHSGVKTISVLIAGYAIAAAGAAATGIVQTARQGSASPQSFPELAIECIAACMIGGGSLNGGRGTMLGAAVGAVVIAATENVVTLLSIKPEWKDLVVGLLLLFSMGLRMPRLSGRRGSGLLEVGKLTWGDIDE